jgi:diguanylate cyclase (GGDEF)-like protein
MSARGRFTCLLASLTVFGCTIFGVSAATGHGDHHAAGSGTPAAVGTTGPQSSGQGDGAGTPAAGGTGVQNTGTPHTGGGPGGQGGPPTTSGGSGDQGGPPTTSGGAGDQGGPPTTSGGAGDQGGPPTTSGDSGGGSTGGGGDHGGGPTQGPPTTLGTPPPTNSGPPSTAGPGPGDGHDHGKHHSGHSLCSGVCGAPNDHQPASTPLIPGAPVSVTPTKTARNPPGNPAPSVGGFALNGGAVVAGPTRHQVAPANPSANSAGLGSVSAAGANTQASSGGLGLLAPATADIGLHSGSRASAHGSASGHGKPAFGGSGATHLLDYTGIGPSAILQIVNVVPTVVWVAIGGLILLAASGTGAAVFNGRRARNHAGQLERVKAVAKTDALTGVLNRRGFTEAVERELARARRHDRPFVLAYVDVRGLKAVNDSEGHLAGDELLKGVATLLTESARADDVVGRIGGDELGLLLVEQSGESADAVTSRIRAQVATRREALGLRTRWDLTVGTAAFPDDGGTFDELLDAADRRLYEKRGIALADGRV